jgi:hypothetical protein
MIQYRLGEKKKTLEQFHIKGEEEKETVSLVPLLPAVGENSIPLPHE